MFTLPDTVTLKLLFFVRKKCHLYFLFADFSINCLACTSEKYFLALDLVLFLLSHVFSNNGQA